MVARKSAMKTTVCVLQNVATVAISVTVPPKEHANVTRVKACAVFCLYHCTLSQESLIPFIRKPLM